MGHLCCWFLLFFLQFLTADFADGEPQIIRPPKNATVLIGTKHALHCETSGITDPRVTWQHYQETLPRRGRNYHIQKSGRLKFSKVSISNTGYYRCMVQNDRGVTIQSDYVFIRVQAPAEIVEGPSDRRVLWGTQVYLQCRVAGEPRPHISWTKDAKPIIEPETEMLYARPYLNINATSTATYECSAENRHIEGATVRKQSATITVIEPDRTEGVCAPYNGSVCRKYLGSQMVYYSWSSSSGGGGGHKRQQNDHERIVLGLWEEMMTTFDTFCRIPAEMMLCRYAFPNCDMSGDEPQPKPLCRENCLAVKDLFCDSEWLTIISNKAEGIFFKNRAHFRLPHCQSLPSHSNNSQNCSPIDLFDITENKVTTTCYNGDGRYYKGTVNRTMSGFSCQAWDSQRPQKHRRDPRNFSILGGATNHCRNPGGEESRPWCYTTDKVIRWEYCDVPRCDENVTFAEKTIEVREVTSSDMDEVKSLLTLETIVIAVAVAVISLALVGFILFLCYRLCRHTKQAQYNAAPQYDVDVDVEKLSSNMCYHQREPRSLLSSKLEKLEYPRNDIVYIRDIGQGAFGRVFQAKAPHLLKGLESTFVAVKMLKDEATDEMLDDFEQEASLMVDFKHPNIIKLLGVCAIGKPLCLLFEYMSKGDLNDFLRNCSPEHFIVRRRSNEQLSEIPKLDHIEQVAIAKQIAAGMVYLADRGFVHRDLATRNCLCGDNLTVKISDFGLARKVHDGDYYKGSEHDAIPIRWMPTESILYNTFSTESDVWSFGVVLWEIFSFALQPYYGMTHEEVVRYVKDGKVLSCPDNTPQDVYDVMKRCWERMPHERPSFASLHKSLSLLQDETAKRTKKADREKV